MDHRGADDTSDAKSDDGVEQCLVSNDLINVAVRAAYGSQGGEFGQMVFGA